MLSLIKIRIRFLGDTTNNKSFVFQKMANKIILEIKLNHGKISVMKSLMRNDAKRIAPEDCSNVKQMIKKNNIRVPRRNDFRKQG
ncbi:MAG: hypothetical protein E7165_04280 [Firmicutes bacterium]|nr:hypothetical protein [Bacillota bacterium]